MNAETSQINHQSLLREVVERHLHGYFSTLDGQPPTMLYELVIKEVERGLFKTVLIYCAGNHSKAAEWLGLSRNTLRKRLADYGLEI